MALTILKREKPRKEKLGWEITITLVIKVAVIYFLWWMFFSDPVDEDLSGPQVGNILFGTVGNEPADSTNQSIIPKEK